MSYKILCRTIGDELIKENMNRLLGNIMQLPNEDFQFALGRRAAKCTSLDKLMLKMFQEKSKERFHSRCLRETRSNESKVEEHLQCAAWLFAKGNKTFSGSSDALRESLQRQYLQIGAAFCLTWELFDKAHETLVSEIIQIVGNLDVSLKVLANKFVNYLVEFNEFWKLQNTQLNHIRDLCDSVSADKTTHSECLTLIHHLVAAQKAERQHFIDVWVKGYAKSAQVLLLAQNLNGEKYDARIEQYHNEAKKQLRDTSRSGEEVFKGPISTVSHPVTSSVSPFDMARATNILPHIEGVAAELRLALDKHSFSQYLRVLVKYLETYNPGILH